eukprot:CAMPEP_0172607314 /NCGR_PEP_ID=MMETSP1068-20121228/27515_1 /TAXON_ID=35684 /ORGANISM="Pseudopedinella elastica, Strain CCMP716" /LENGTH=104 /DNA_ID=CAMNT_0013410287 /DNA_START=805 /DNA_END=1120 /DNA_ORIENTATION=+
MSVAVTRAPSFAATSAVSPQPLPSSSTRRLPSPGGVTPTKGHARLGALGRPSLVMDAAAAVQVANLQVRKTVGSDASLDISSGRELARRSKRVRPNSTHIPREL